MASIVQAVNLGKQVQSGGQPLLILQDVNFSVEAGESLAILGASGSGNGTIQFTVAANTGAQRTAMLTVTDTAINVADTVITITQSAP